jgi:transcriptional regulator PpsR
VSGNSDHPRDLGELSGWAPELAKTFVSLSSDIALVIDSDGVIRNVAQGQDDPVAPGAYHWVGRPWIDTVSGDTRPKITHLLKEVSSTGIARRREVNHPVTDDSSIPISYTAIRLGEKGPVLAVGRDLRAIAAIQQRYVESQQDMERGYWQARQAEARYQLLFQVATDAVMVLDAETFQIIEANNAAVQLYGVSAQEMHGRPVSFAFEHHSRGALNELLGNARRTGESGEIRARLQGTHTSTSVVATPFRTQDAMRLLVRLRTIDAANAASSLTQNLSRLVDQTRDGVVVTDSSGRIRIANPAFLALVRQGSEKQVTNEPLMNWLGLEDRPLAALVAQVRRDGIVRQVRAFLRHAGGHSGPQREAARAVEVSATLLTEGDQECIGFTIHPITEGAAPGAGAVGVSLSEHAEALRSGIEALAAQVGERALADLVVDATALAERHFAAIAQWREAGASGEGINAASVPPADTPAARGADPC